MPIDSIETCPACSGRMEHGLSLTNAGLPFYRPDAFASFVVIGEDLNQRSLLTKLFPSRARWSKAHVCRSCRVAVVEYGTSLSRKEANALAASVVRFPTR